MNIRLILNIAFSLLRARIKQSIVAAVGVTFGIATYIALISFMSGLNQMLDGLIINRTPHVRLYNQIKPLADQPLDMSAQYSTDSNFVSSVKPRDRKKQIHNSTAIIASLRQDARVIDVAPKVMTQVFFRTGAIEMAGVVNGVDVVAEEKLFHFSEYVIEGNMYDLATVTNCVFIGKGIAQKMMVSVGDVIQVTAPNGEITSLKIGGILQFGLADVDDTQSYASLQTVQKLLGETASYITDLNVKLKDINIAPDLAKEFAKTYEVDTIDIQTANSQFETGSTVRSIISYAVGITLLIVAGFGVYNILNMMIYEKMDSIAILKATGFSGGDVKAIFISLSMIIGITGGVCGLLFGLGLSVVIDNIPFNTAALPTIKTFPIYYTGIHYVIGIIFSIVTTYIAGLFPARKAGRIDPVVIIRGK